MEDSQFTCLGGNTEKYTTFTVPIENEVRRIDKNGEEVPNYKKYIYKLLIVQDLWQAHYQTLSIIFLKELLELNVNTDMTIKNVKFIELNISIVTVFLNAQILKMI